MRTIHVQTGLPTPPQSAHPNYPPCARACMLLNNCNNYGSVGGLSGGLLALRPTRALYLTSTSNPQLALESLEKESH